MKDSPIIPTVDFEQEGVQHGFLKQPHSDDRSAWGAIMTPLTVFRHGEGPTVLLTGANHGDEYEGPIALLNLINDIRLTEVSGRIIFIPMMNYPAFRAGTRTSPIDHGNMNRVFPGKPDGTATEKMADYFQRILLPMADYVLDMHSGGKSLSFVPFAAAHVLEDKAQQARCEAAMSAFCAPYSVMLLELDSVGMYDTAAEAQGKVFVTTELGGGGSTSSHTNDIALTGAINFCIHAGVLDRPPFGRPSIELNMPGAACFITAQHSGLLELVVDPGDPVCEGQLVAKVHEIERTGLPPVEYHSVLDGLVIGRHFPGLIRSGDNLAVIGVPE